MRHARRLIRVPRLAATAPLVTGASALAIALGACGGSHAAAQAPAATTHAAAPTTTMSVARASAAPSGGAPAEPPASQPAAPQATRPARHITVGVLTVTFTDPVRTMDLAGRRVPRSVRTVIRYPVGLPGPFPLIVFGHGYAVTPTPYAPLLDAWTRAGYVVAAPIFPLENANAPGGPDEHDMVNQPGDMSLVISELLSAPSPAVARVGRLLARGRIAVTGQSDGGDTALAAAYGPGRDPRVSVAMILSGAEDPFAPPFRMPAHGPPLLAIQGTADTINPPWQTYQFYDEAAPPKYLLRLLGASHLPPYTEPGPELTLVEHMTLAFLKQYLKGRSRAFPRYLAAGSAGPGSILTFSR